MSRGMWFGAGMAAGVYSVLRARRIAEAFTVDGLRDRVGALVVGARVFREEVDQGRSDAEIRLRERYEVRAGAQHRELSAARRGGPPTPTENAPEKGTD